jgi:hypothetical protein
MQPVSDRLQVVEEQLPLIFAGPLVITLERWYEVAALLVEDLLQRIRVGVQGLSLRHRESV